MAARTAGRMWRMGAIGLLVVCGTLLAPGRFAAAQAPPAPAPPPPQTSSAGDLATRAWTTARGNGSTSDVLAVLRRLQTSNDPNAVSLAESVAALDKNIEKREEARSAKLKEVNEKFDKQLEQHTPESLSEAVKLAVELYLISTDRDAVKRDPRVSELVKGAAAAAREAEGKGDWFTANELFFRLNALMEEEGTYKADSRRLAQRLGMIRLYAPEQFWKLRNDERLQAGKSPLPPYNGLGENYKEKLDGVDDQMVLRALVAASRQQYDRVIPRDIMLAGIDALRVMFTTTDLQKVFPTLAEPAPRDAMLAFLDAWAARIKQPSALITSRTMSEFVEDLQAQNKKTLRLPDTALLHEFGNGGMGRLDDFSAIIWPDEVARFDRMTQGNFKGVGIQIQLDEESQMIKVVTPLEGTPAQRAGILAGDLIKKINGQPAVGISLNQAVDLITGPSDTKVTLTVERTSRDKSAPAPDLTQELDFNLVRTLIPQPSVKGWRRTGPHENEWDWFIDRPNQIGYVRLLQFTEETTSDLHQAIRAMQDQLAGEGQNGIKGLILDLRFNPGGLLTEAVSVANTFIDHGTIVSTEGVVPGETKVAQPGAALLRGVPVVVLINEGSASASEIVSGAIRHYADKGEINALVIGERSFGKGSVQNVWPLAANAKMKLTTQLYKLPDGRTIHKVPHATVWGVDPHIKVDMLPESESDALKLRQDSDVLPIDASGKVVESGTPRPDPARLITDGLDLQLQTGLVMLQAKKVASTAIAEQARLPQPPPAVSQ